MILAKPEKSKVEVERFIPNIKTLTMNSKVFTLYVDSEGHIKPKNQYPLLSEVSGKILFLSDFFDSNLIFSEGDTLVKIDSSNYSILRRNAKSKLDLAVLENLKQKAIYDRSKTELGQYNSSSVNDLAKKIPQLQSSNSYLDAAKANYEKAELDIEKTIVLAPFRGRVKKSHISSGMHISPNMTLANIYSLDDMIVKLPLSIKDADLLGFYKQESSIIGADEVSVKLKALIGSNYHDIEAKYMGVSGSIDNLTQKIYLTAEIGNLSKNIIVDDNLFVNAKIYGKKYYDVFQVPNEAIIENKYVHIVENKKLYKREIKILKKYKDYSIVDKGLFNGDIINLTILEYYIDGMDIEVLN
jgi:RND family efflux transporter MFP subunit